MKVNIWSVVFVSQPGKKPVLDLGGKFELTVNEDDVESLSIMDVFKIFKNGQKKYKIQGKAFWFRYKNQNFFITRMEDDFKVYALE